MGEPDARQQYCEGQEPRANRHALHLKDHTITSSSDQSGPHRKFLSYAVTRPVGTKCRKFSLRNGAVTPATSRQSRLRTRPRLNVRMLTQHERRPRPRFLGGGSAQPRPRSTTVKREQYGNRGRTGLQRIRGQWIHASRSRPASDVVDGSRPAREARHPSIVPPSPCSLASLRLKVWGTLRADAHRRARCGGGADGGGMPHGQG